jgi:phosphoribosylamine--glycine ligase
MKILIIGSGGREHAIAHKLSESKGVSEIFIAPGNAGTNQIGKNVLLDVNNQQEVINFCNQKKIDLIVIGPEVPLVEGLADILRKNNFNVFGPDKEAAAIEGNKKFAKELMQEYKIPTAQFKTFNKDEYETAKEYLNNSKYPVVIKASGLAAGKGVIIAQSKEEALNSLKEIMQEEIFGNAGKEIVIEEFLEGEELSVFAITDGDNYVLLPAAQDHKRIGEGDTGKNTGGMGAYAPLSFVDSEIISEIENFVVKPTLKALKEKNKKFNGCLYCGLINTKDGIKVIEFNCRFGDPETQVVLPLLEGDFFELLYSTAKDKINKNAVKYNGGSAMCVVTVSGGYPDKYQKGFEIKGLEEINNPNIQIIHAGTKLENGKILTNGGRVLNVVSFLDENKLRCCKTMCYDAIAKVEYKDKYYRTDIGFRAIK